MANQRRRRKVAEFVHKELSDLLQFEVKDPRVGFVTVTGVDMNADLTVATVHFSVLGDEETEALSGLESAAPFLRRELGKRLRIRQTPAINFRVDRSMAYAQHIENLLSSIDIPPEDSEDSATPDEE